MKADAPYEELKRALLEVEKRWLREAKTEVERQQTRRSIAEDLVSQAYSFDMPWEEFGQWLRRVQRLGFSNLALRVHIACLYVQSLHLFPRRAHYGVSPSSRSLPRAISFRGSFWRMRR